ncbi:MAG: ECF transporter S component [Ruminococcaceae bacterium]|nr:ECF transporter S component [Oscillospiraceae bacterium]
MKSKIRAITYGGILSAVILLATYIIKFPIPGGYGYINFGDGAIFAAAVVLGPFAGICAALGSTLADLLAGFPHYMLPTLLIKGLMGLIAGFVLIRKPRLPWPGQLLLFAVCEMIMVGGYFIAEIFLYGLAAAAGTLVFNTLQGLAGIATGLTIVPLARRIKI